MVVSVLGGGSGVTNDYIGTSSIEQNFTDTDVSGEHTFSKAGQPVLIDGSSTTSYGSYQLTTSEDFPNPDIYDYTIGKSLNTGDTWEILVGGPNGSLTFGSNQLYIVPTEGGYSFSNTNGFLYSGGVLLDTYHTPSGNLGLVTTVDNSTYKSHTLVHTGGGEYTIDTRTYNSSNWEWVKSDKAAVFSGENSTIDVVTEDVSTINGVINEKTTVSTTEYYFLYINNNNNLLKHNYTTGEETLIRSGYGGERTVNYDTTSNQVYSISTSSDSTSIERFNLNGIFQGYGTVNGTYIDTQNGLVATSDGVYDIDLDQVREVNYSGVHSKNVQKIENSERTYDVSIGSTTGGSFTSINATSSTYDSTTTLVTGQTALKFTPTIEVSHSVDGWRVSYYFDQAVSGALKDILRQIPTIIYAILFFTLATLLWRQ